MIKISYTCHRFPPDVIQYAVWLYFRFPLSYRDVEELLAERNIDVSYEAVRRWTLKFGQSFARRLMKNQGFIPDAFVTDKLPSYGAALGELKLSKHHDFGGRKNNRAENSHLPVRQRERRMQKFKSPGSAQRSLSIHSAIYNTFYVQHHLISRKTLRKFHDEAMSVWQAATAAA